MTSSISNAADVHWKGGSGNNLWTTPGNWEFNKVPAVGDNVFVNMPEAKAPNGPLIQDGMDLKINGLSCEVAGEPTMTMTGGTLEITDYIWWGDDNNSHGIFNMSGGTITVGNEFELGWGGGTGTWTMTGGEITCGELIIPTGSGAAGELFLHGGTVNVGSQGLEMTDVGMIDVGDGTLVLDGDVTATVQGYIDSGVISADGGGGRVILDFDRTNPGKTTLAAAWTGVAYNPNPKDGAYHPDTWANISWSADEAAVSHDVYFGDDFEDVDNGTGDTFRGNQGETFYVVGFPGFPYPEGLVPGTTYYWRIDEVEADGTVHKGDVWSFIVPPKIAYEPDPADGAEFVDPNAELSWTPGYGAKLHTVYFGTDYDEASNATGGAPQGTATYSPSGPLDREKVYYWRVDEFDAMNTHKGEVWAFSTPGAVGSPDPANGAAGVQMTATLSWTPGETATSSEVYLGTDKDAVRNATSASPEYKGSRAAGSESLDPGELDWHSAYYWRVDGIGAAGSVKGNVWSFETADFITVDDFESYNDLAEDDPDSNRIYLTWIDGFETTTNGAVVGYAELPLTEHGNVHGGRTSMPYSYDNNGKYSEANMTLVNPRDWTEEGVGVLSLWFNGNASNDPEAIYVVLNGTAVVYHDDPAATQAPEWTRWTIDLDQFASQGVDLTNVDSIGIGFGDKNNVQAGGAGKMLFDDIALYRAEAPTPTLTVGLISSLEAERDPADPATLTAVLNINGIDAGDLIVGITTTDFEKHAGREAVHADNLDLTAYASLDDSTFIKTVFAQPVTTIFIMERGANDSGFFQALDAGGNPIGEMVPFTASDFQLPEADLKIVNQSAGGVAIESDVPIGGLLILPPEGGVHSIDPASISAVAAQ
jgi:hypothetical protein